MRDVLVPEAIIPSLEGMSKKQVLQDCAERISKLAQLDATLVCDVLWEREKLGTTGIGGGIAIPHGRVAGLDKVRGVFARLATPVSFDSVDEKPVDLVFLLLAPLEAGADHLHALASVSRLLRNKDLCEKLRKAKNQESLFRLLTETPIADAA